MGTPQTGSIEFDLEKRMEQVVGPGPRIESLGGDSVNEHLLGLVNAVRAGAGAPPVGGEEVPDYMRLMMKHPEIFPAQMDMGAIIFNGHIPPRERELAVLRCGWLCRAPYEWGAHVDIGKRVGLSDEEVERIQRGSSAEGWNEHDRAIIRGVEELIADQAMSGETWDTLAKTWDEAQMIEYPMMVGQYVATAMVQNSIRVRMMPGNPGLSHK